MGNEINSPRPAQFVSEKPDKMIYTPEQIDELYEIVYKFRNGSISMEEVVCELRGGGLLLELLFLF